MRYVPVSQLTTSRKLKQTLIHSIKLKNWLILVVIKVTFTKKL